MSAQRVRFPTRVVLAVLGWLALSLLATLWWAVRGDWRLLLAFLVWSVFSYGVGFSLALWDVRTDGYTVEKRADMTGRRRWRVTRGGEEC